MDKYSRLLLHFSTVSSSNNEQEPYPNFVKELVVLESPSEELCRIIKEDLPTILPAILILSIHDDVCIRRAIARTYPTFCSILKTHPSVKKDSWWRDMEDKLIAQNYSSSLVKMVEKNEEPWADNWVFVINLIVVNSDQVPSFAINSLLKVVETAFKMSKKNEQIMEKAYFCWNKLIDIFSVHPRVTVSAKLLELFVRPLSTTHLSLKCPELKMKTWQNLMRKVGRNSTCAIMCTTIIEPFVDNMYLKDDSLCVHFPNDCLKALSEIMEQKKFYKHYANKVVAAFPACYQTVHTEEEENLLVDIWRRMIENIPDVTKEYRNEYILEIFAKLSQLSKNEKHNLNTKLCKVIVEKNVFSIDNVRRCFESVAALVPTFSVLLQYQDFRDASFSLVVKSLNESFSESNNKVQNGHDLQVWDMLCESYTMWIRSVVNPQEICITDNESLCSLLMIPFTFKQWSVMAVQKTWYALVDALQETGCGSSFLSLLFEKLISAIKMSHIPITVCIEILNRLTEKDKTVFKMVMPTLTVAAHHVSPKEPKPLMDILVLLANALNHVPKNDLSKFVNELMGDVNKYEHPWGIRIKTKCSKVLRKLLMVKESCEDQDQKTQPLQDNASPLSARSPIMAQSNFLQRLAKAEEKKKKKAPTHSSVFGDGSPALIIESAEKLEVSGKTSPINNISLVADKTKAKETLALKAPLETNGRVSPVLPPVVTITVPSRSPRARPKSPEVGGSKPSKQKRFVKTPPPPTYFDESAQEEYVVVPPKPKTTPLTEHQKEMLSKRRTDIPALYQDLSQDTQSQSQSIKEINLLQYINSSKKMDEPSVFTTSTDKSINTIEKKQDVSVIVVTDTNQEASPNNDSSVCQITQSKEDTKPSPLKMQENVVEVTSDEPKSYSADMFSEISEVKEKSIANSENLVEVKTSVEKPEDSFDSIENTLLIKSSEPLNSTPTKQSGPPTPRNLVSKLNLLEDIDEEEEREKENKIINAKLIGDKAAITPVKRRSVRKSAGKYSSKSTDETQEIKLKPKHETKIDLPKIVIEAPDTPGEKSNPVCKIDAYDKKNDDKQEINVTNKSIVDNDSALSSSDHSECKSEDFVPSDKIKLAPDINENNFSAFTDSDNIDSKTKACNESVVVLQNNDNKDDVSLNSKPVESLQNITKSLELVEGGTELDDTLKISNIEIEENIPLINEDLKNKSIDVINLSDENSESPSGDISSWTMTTAPSGKVKTRKKKNFGNLSQYSPKVLRSKRLSLTKNKEGTAPDCKKIKKSPIIMNATKMEIDGETLDAGIKESVNNLTEVLDENSDIKSTQQTPKIEITPNRKRRIINEGTEVEDKKKKIDDDVSQDSLIVVKNNPSGKPRKKKVIKSNVKHSSNNLEQWLIKSGKTIVKTSLISQKTEGSEVEPSKIIESSPDIQINVNETKNIFVEKLETLNQSEEISISPLRESVNEKAENDSNSESPIKENSEVIHSSLSLPANPSLDGGASGGVLQTSSSEEEGGLESLKCDETELPSTPELDVKELLLRRRRLMKREGTPARELIDVEDDGKRPTPFRPHRSGRSGQMVMMVTSEEEPAQIRTPIRKRSSIPHFTRTENWPEGRMEQWVPCLPTPPGVSPSLGILKKRSTVLSPSNSPSTSPQTRRKRVSFLDPVVYSGLMYAKGCSEAQGEVQYANIPPGEKPIWKADDDYDNTDVEKENESKVEESSVLPVVYDSTDELTAIQDFLNSTPDAPWRKSVPPEVDLANMPDLETCEENVDELFKFISTDKERGKTAIEKLKKLNIQTIADFRSVSLTDLANFCVTSLTSIIEEYIREKKTRSKKADSAEETPNDEEVLKSKLSVKDKDVNLEKSVSNVEAFRMDQELTDTHKNVSKRKVKGDMKINDNNEVCQEKTELVQDIIKDVGDKNTQTLDKSNQCQESTISHARKFSATSIASHAQGLPEEEYVTFLRTVFQGMAKDRVLLSISTAVNILLEQKIGCNP